MKMELNIDRFPFKLMRGMELVKYVPKRELIIKKNKVTLEIKYKEENGDLINKTSGIFDEKGKMIESVWVGWQMHSEYVDGWLRSLHRYPSSNDEKIDLPTIKEIVEPIISGCRPTRIAKEYYNKPCVIGYAIRPTGGAIYIKTKRLYKGLIVNLGEMYDTDFEYVQKRYDEIVSDKMITQDISDEHKAGIIAMKV